jgi:hypothetical protein
MNEKSKSVQVSKIKIQFIQERLLKISISFFSKAPLKRPKNMPINLNSHQLELNPISYFCVKKIFYRKSYFNLNQTLKQIR